MGLSSCKRLFCDLFTRRTLLSSTYDTQRIHCNTQSQRDTQNDPKPAEKLLRRFYTYTFTSILVVYKLYSFMSVTSSPSACLGPPPPSSWNSLVRPLRSNSWFQSASRSVWLSGHTHTRAHAHTCTHTHVQQQSAAHTSSETLKLHISCLRNQHHHKVNTLWCMFSHQIGLYIS